MRRVLAIDCYRQLVKGERGEKTIYIFFVKKAQFWRNLSDFTGKDPEHLDLDTPEGLPQFQQLSVLQAQVLIVMQ